MRMAWPQYDGVRQQSRLPSITNTQERVLPLELAILLSAGFLAAAASIVVDLGTLKAMLGIHLKTPGHAIVRAVFPMAFGLAAAPRRGAGCVMGGSAVVSMTLFQWSGFGSVGFGAMTSLFATGPCLDVAVH